MKHKNIPVFIPHAGCPHRCSFCNQNAISGRAEPPRLDEVERILQSAAAGITDRENCEIAFFGGSFTCIERGYMRSLLELASHYVQECSFAGIRLSTRPDAVGEDVLALLAEYPVTTVELGAQSMDDEVLCKNGRGHTSADVAGAAARIRAAGLSLGLQMMVGLYGESEEGALDTAHALAALSPDFVRVYPVAVLRGTPLGEWMLSGKYTPPTLEEGISLCADILWYFHTRGIPVIKFGLHASPDVERDLLGGIYHPALRELCESEIYFRRAVALLSGREGCESTLCVGRNAVSKMIGQKRNNLQRLAARSYPVRVVAEDGLGIYEIKIKDE